MNVWLVQLGEPLPIDGAVRLYRTGILAKELANRGHRLVWWATTFDHTHKTQRYETSRKIQVDDDYYIVLLHSKGYTRNISLDRLRFYWDLANKLKKNLEVAEAPDVILTSLPTPELSKVMIDYGIKYHVPVIVDVRDLWPDTFINVVPPVLRGLGRVALFPLVRRNKSIFRAAASIVGISDEYLNWALSYAGRQRNDCDRVFPLGYDAIELQENEKNQAIQALFEMGVDKHKTICCFLGTFGASYDLETVVRAARILKQEGVSNLQFVLCGDGQQFDRVNSLAYGLDNVILTGWVSRPIIGALLEIASIGLAPYVRNAPQSLPNKPFEYLSGGLAIVSSLHGELEELLDENRCGITYEAGNDKELARLLRYLVMHPDVLRDMSTRAKLLFNDRYSADRIYPKMADYIEWIVGGHGGLRIRKSLTR